MRVVLQNNSTSLYLGTFNQWTPRCKEAHDFRSLDDVLEFSSREELKDVQVVVIVERNQGIQFCPISIQRLLEARSQVATHHWTRLS